MVEKLKKYLVLSGIFLMFASCSSLTKQQRTERSMFDPQRKGSELREQRKHEKSRKQKKAWVSQPKRR